MDSNLSEGNAFCVLEQDTDPLLSTGSNHPKITENC